MAKSPDEGRAAQYARPAPGAAITGKRAVALWGGLLTAALVSLFVSLGLWQFGKWQAKTTLQADLDSRSQGALVAMPGEPVDGEALRYRHFVLHGEYDASRQVLIDNRLYQERAGYHVLTPFKLAGSSMHVLINRGWVPAPADHKLLPEVPVPAGTLDITGIAVIPASRFFTLAAQPASGWEPVWQNPDLERFRQVVSYPLQPVILQLDATAPGGFFRDWPRPDERADRHLSYALQWFGFAASSVGIWLFFLLRRP